MLRLTFLLDQIPIDLWLTAGSSGRNNGPGERSPERGLQGSVSPVRPRLQKHSDSGLSPSSVEQRSCQNQESRPGEAMQSKYKVNVMFDIFWLIEFLQ